MSNLRLGAPVLGGKEKFEPMPREFLIRHSQVEAQSAPFGDILDKYANYYLSCKEIRDLKSETPLVFNQVKIALRLYLLPLKLRHTSASDVYDQHTILVSDKAIQWLEQYLKYEEMRVRALVTTPAEYADAMLDAAQQSMLRSEWNQNPEDFGLKFALPPIPAAKVKTDASIVGQASPEELYRELGGTAKLLHLKDFGPYAGIDEKFSPIRRTLFENEDSPKSHLQSTLERLTGSQSFNIKLDFVLWEISMPLLKDFNTTERAARHRLWEGGRLLDRLPTYIEYCNLFDKWSFRAKQRYIDFLSHNFKNDIAVQGYFDTLVLSKKLLGSYYGELRSEQRLALFNALNGFSKGETLDSFSKPRLCSVSFRRGTFDEAFEAYVLDITLIKQQKAGITRVSSGRSRFSSVSASSSDDEAISPSSHASSVSMGSVDSGPIDLKTHHIKARDRLKRNLCMRSASKVAEKSSLKVDAVCAALMLFNVSSEDDIESLRTFLSVAVDSSYASSDEMTTVVEKANLAHAFKEPTVPLLSLNTSFDAHPGISAA